MNLLDILETGKENALSLEYLSKKSGMSKRAVRDEINRINTSGEEVICNDGDGLGYYIAANAAEANAYRALIEATGNLVLRKTGALHDAWNVNFPDR